MQPPSRQPIGFWTVRAGEAVRARTRGALGEIGVTQPEWWVLHQLSLHPDGVGRAEVVETIGPNDTPVAIESAIESAIEKGWIRAEGTHLRASEAGTEQFERAAAIQQALQAERIRGISAEDFATTITVLQKTIANVGGDAWQRCGALTGPSTGRDDIAIRPLRSVRSARPARTSRRRRRG